MNRYGTIWQSFYTDVETSTRSVTVTSYRCKSDLYNFLNDNSKQENAQRQT